MTEVKAANDPQHEREVFELTDAQLAEHEALKQAITVNLLNVMEQRPKGLQHLPIFAAIESCAAICAGFFPDMGALAFSDAVAVGNSTLGTMALWQDSVLAAWKKAVSELVVKQRLLDQAEDPKIIVPKGRWKH